MLKLWLGAKFAEPLGVELTLGQVQGAFSGTDFWHIALTAEPWADRRLSPYLSVGIGQFKNFPNSTLVGATLTDARLAHAGLGVRWYLAERFVVRADWTLYTAFVGDTRSLEYRATTLGIAFFF
jgi:hemolysin activation/secretion protein